MKYSIIGKIFSVMFQEPIIILTWMLKMPEFSLNWNGMHFYLPVKQQIPHYEKLPSVMLLHSESKDNKNSANTIQMKRLLRFRKVWHNIQE